MEEGKKVVATKYMKDDEFWFKGHFPDYPVVPGVLMLEMMAQAGAVSMLVLPENKGKLGFFGGVKEAKFRSRQRSLHRKRRKGGIRRNYLCHKINTEQRYTDVQ